jgi:hypothetical protein
MAQEPALSALRLGYDAGDVKRAILVQLEKHGRGFTNQRMLESAAHDLAQERSDDCPRPSAADVMDVMRAATARQAHQSESQGSDDTYVGSQDSAYGGSLESNASDVEEHAEQATSGSPRANAGDAAAGDALEGEDAGFEDSATAAKQRKKSDDNKDNAEEIDFMCKICADGKVEVVMLPCGHLCSCQSCAGALVDCPICRQKVAGYVRVYLS